MELQGFRVLGIGYGLRGWGFGVLPQEKAPQEALSETTADDEVRPSTLCALLLT